jgi:endogenous inhibitor of DNA gyrase (YacG/DUF329 family)
VSVRKRLERLERLEDTRSGCPECGFDGDWSKGTFELTFPLDVEGEEEGPEETVYCETCGTPVVIVVTWDDLRDPPPRPLGEE